MSTQYQAPSYEFDLDTVPVPLKELRSEVIEGELLLYHPAQTKAVYLNPSAAVIWSLCDGHRRVGEIVELINESYPEAKPSAVEDVLATLQQLSAERVLTVR
jgi:hypothetical protein